MWKQPRSVWRQKQAYTCLEPKTKPRTQRPVPCKARWGRDVDELISLLHKIWFCSLTKNYMVSVYFPGWAVGQLGGVEVGVLLSIRTHRLDHLPTNFIMRFLHTEIKRNQILWWIHEVTPRTLCQNMQQIFDGPCNSNGGSTTVQLEVYFIWILTFFHRMMRMMRKMTAMMTNTRTTAKTTTWDRRAEHR